MSQQETTTEEEIITVDTREKSQGRNKDENNKLDAKVDLRRTKVTRKAETDESNQVISYNIFTSLNSYRN